MPHFNLLFAYTLAPRDRTVTTRTLMRRYEVNPTASAALVTEIATDLCYFARPSPKRTSASTVDNTVGAANCLIHPQLTFMGTKLAAMSPVTYELVRFTKTQLKQLRNTPFGFLYFVSKGEMNVSDSQFIGRREVFPSA